MWIMLEWQLRQMGAESLATNRAALDMMLPAMSKFAESSYPVLSKAPLYLRETLLFPYTAGLLFQQTAVEQRGRQAFAQVLTDPPLTTHEVLHPEAWMQKLKFTPPALPAWPEGSRYHRVSSGILGELDLQILLKQYARVEDAARLAPLWRGGAYELAEHKASRRPALRWSVAFDSPDSARHFLTLYRKVLEGKSERLLVETSGPDLVGGANTGGRFRIEARGPSVTALEALQP